MAKEEPEEFKYGIDELAKKMGIQPASARVQLRKHKVKRAGRAYGWNSMADIEAVVKKIQEGVPTPAKKSPVKKAAAKKTAKRTKKIETEQEAA